MMNEADYHRALSSTPKRMAGLLVIIGLSTLVALYVTTSKERLSSWADPATEGTMVGATVFEEDRRAFEYLPAENWIDLDAPSEAGLVVRGGVRQILEGDALLVGQTPIQVSVLDCAATTTVFGKVAAHAALDLVQGQALSCQLMGRQVGNLQVAECTLEDGRDFGQTMLQAGVCGNARW